MTETLTTAESADLLKVIEGLEIQGSINTTDDVIREHIAHSIRLGYPQIKPQGVQMDRVCLVGGGPSLEDTFDELKDLYFSGAKVVTVNGAYRWCLEHNIRPSAQIVLDARAENARFVNPAIPQCRYLVASQCHRDTWTAVEGRHDVWIWHAAGADSPHRELLDAYYCGRWAQMPGGTTVIVRALLLLRLIGYVRFDLFGVDSCFMGTKHHAYAQPENDGDKPAVFTVQPTGHPELARNFVCAGWHVKQLECFLQTIRLYGDKFKIRVHGDGLLAYALSASANVEWSAVNGDGAQG